MLDTHGEDGFPHIKAMLKVENQGLKKIWFRESKRSQHLK